MGRSARVTRFFGDGDHTFALLIDQLEEIQEQFDCGLEETREHLASLRVKDILAVIRLGLIGGGLDKQAAYRLVVRHVVPGELASCAVLAVEVVNAAIAGVADEPLGEDQGERTETHSPEEKSGLLTSTELAQLWDLAPNKSDDAPSGSSERPSKAGQKPTAAKKPASRRARANTTKT